MYISPVNYRDVISRNIVRLLERGLEISVAEFYAVGLEVLFKSIPLIAIIYWLIPGKVLWGGRGGSPPVAGAIKKI